MSCRRERRGPSGIPTEVQAALGEKKVRPKANIFWTLLGVFSEFRESNSIWILFGVSLIREP